MARTKKQNFTPEQIAADPQCVLSERQKQIFAYVKDFTREKGYPPTVREIGAATGLSSTATVFVHLKKLEELGFLERDSQKPRTMSFHEDYSWKDKTVVPVPLIGRVTAGVPILAVENIEETYPIPLDLLGSSEDLFMLTVNGDSMINAGIHDQDYIIVRKQNTANNGEIVVALIDGEETTVKRYYRMSSEIRLQPENEAYKPIIGGDNIQVIGKVVALFRTF